MRDGTKLPQGDAAYRASCLPNAAVTPDPERHGQWLVHVSLPQNYLDPEAAPGRTLFVVLHEIDDDPRDESAPDAPGGSAVIAHALAAEVRLLRSELDLLKRAFRRHCIETG